jgi:hypothetical protein
MYRPEQTSQRAHPTKEILMAIEHAKLARRNASELPLERAHAEQVNKTGSAVKKAIRKKAVATRAKPARLLQNRLGSESKSDELVCRYCGSDDLARVSSSGGTDAGNVSVNATARRRGRRTRGSRYSRHSARQGGRTRKGSALFHFVSEVQRVQRASTKSHYSRYFFFWISSLQFGRYWPASSCAVDFRGADSPRALKRGRQKSAGAQVDARRIRSVRGHAKAPIVS